MYLRKLEQRDAAFMLEWMHDESVVCHLGTNFAAKTIHDCRNFIESSHADKENLHFAIANDADEYMGTVSLKHIDPVNRWAEFAITVRSAAMGKGYSRYAMEQILHQGLDVHGLVAIYWCVSPKNQRAVRFYDKHGYRRTEQVPAQLRECYGSDMELFWYIYDGENK